MEIIKGARVDRFELIEQLGAGGQGSVWRARDLVHHVDCAVKLFDLSALQGTAPERARREAQFLSTLSHPSLPKCHGLFEAHSEDLIGIVFDLVLGASLERATSDRRLTDVHRVAILRHLASVLDHVHSSGVAHRDLSPANVMIGETFWADPRAEGSVILLDFGLAVTHESPTLTAKNKFVGRPPYLAPEVLVGRLRASGGDDRRRDVFAFGVLGWWLLHGAHPSGLPWDARADAFTQAYREALDGRRSWPASSSSGAVDEVIRSCLELDPKKRASFGLVNRLESLLPVALTPPPPQPATLPTLRRHVPTKILLFSASAVFALCAVFAIRSWSRNAVPVECCGQSECQSLAPCVPGAGADTLPERDWLFRYSWGKRRGATDVGFSALQDLYPNAKLCMRRATSAPGDWTCWPMQPVQTPQAGTMHVDTSDLERGILEMSIQDAGRTIAQGRVQPIEDHFKTSALCRGILLRVTDSSKTQFQLGAFIDQP